MDAKTLVDYAASLDCIHCGLCLRTCPTYRLTGEESSSPRGRIYMMRGVAEERLDPTEPAFAEEMDFCLVCRHCESVCPAGVRFGEMMEHTRDRLEDGRRRGPLERLARWIGFRVVLPSRALLRLASGALRLAQRTGLLRLAAPLLGERGRAARDLPAVPRRGERRPLPETTPARGERRGAVAVLAGCVMPELYGRVNRATVDTLSALGLECRVPTDHACCGALHAHNGDLEGARDLARTTIEAFERTGDVEAIVVNSAGCGAHMKDYERLLEDDPAWSRRARELAARVRDFAEVAARHCGEGAGPSAFPSRPELGTVAWDDPCHLCHGQGIRSEPRRLLDLVADLERVELPESESCCGSAGIYSLLRPGDSAAVFASKLEALERCGADTLVTANPGCQLQWETGLARAGRSTRVLHLAEVLAPRDTGAD